MPIECAGARLVQPQMDFPGFVMTTKLEDFAVHIVDVARERGLEAEWGRQGCDYDQRTGMPKGGYRYYAEVFETTLAHFEQICDIASQRMLP